MLLCGFYGFFVTFSDLCGFGAIYAVLVRFMRFWCDFSLDKGLKVIYNKSKLKRFTGVPLSLVECGDYIKNKKRIKTKQCAPRVGALQQLARESGLVFCLTRMINYYSQPMMPDPAVLA